MEQPQTQVFDPKTENAYRRLDSAMTDAITEMTRASLNKGSVDLDVAKAATDRLVRRATGAYKDVLESGDAKAQAKVLARILAELTVSSTSTWVVATHAGITYRDRDRMKGGQA
jgi:hypothetical protein